MFRQMDSYDKDNKIKRDEFIISLRNLGVNLNQQDLEVIPYNIRLRSNNSKLMEMGLLTLKTL
jgi:hypothetical protein